MELGDPGVDQQVVESHHCPRQRDQEGDYSVGNEELVLVDHQVVVEWEQPDRCLQLPPQYHSQDQVQLDSHQAMKRIFIDYPCPWGCQDRFI